MEKYLFFITMVLIFIWIESMGISSNLKDIARELRKEQKVKETGAYAKGLNAGLNIVKSIMNDEIQTPTAYDVDAVVKHLEKKIQMHERCIEYEKKNGTITEEFQQRKAVEVLKDAIEIVKGGGVDD